MDRYSLKEGKTWIRLILHSISICCKVLIRTLLLYLVVTNPENIARSGKWRVFCFQFPFLLGALCELTPKQVNFKRNMRIACLLGHLGGLGVAARGQNKLTILRPQCTKPGKREAILHHGPFVQSVASNWKVTARLHNAQCFMCAKGGKSYNKSRFAAPCAHSCAMIRIGAGKGT